jgi:CBS domain-containing protein
MGRIRLGSKPPLTVAVDDSVLDAARAMTERQVGAATVLDGGKVVGVVSERDVMRKIVVAGLDAAKTPVRKIMTSPVISVHKKTTVNEAAELMRLHHIRHLVVLDDKEALVGMLALRYLLYDLMGDMQRNVGDLMSYIMTDGPGG